MSKLKELNDELLEKVSGGTQQEANELLDSAMEYYGVSTREEAYNSLTEEQMHIYQVLLDNPGDRPGAYNELDSH